MQYLSNMYDLVCHDTFNVVLEAIYNMHESSLKTKPYTMLEFLYKIANVGINPDYAMSNGQYQMHLSVEKLKSII